jgi:hypothetical protein
VAARCWLFDFFLPLTLWEGKEGRCQAKVGLVGLVRDEWDDVRERAEGDGDRFAPGWNDAAVGLGNQ